MSGSLKTIYLKMAGVGKEASKANEIVLEPGTKVSDVLNKLDLKNYQLFHDGSFLTPDTNLYDLLSDGASLSAMTPSQVGR